MANRLGDILVSWGVITPHDLAHVLRVQSQEDPRQRRRLGRILLDEQRVTEITLAAALAHAYGLRSLDLSVHEVQPEIARTLPHQIAQRALVLPVDRTETSVTLAAADPVDVLGLDDVRMYLRQSLGDLSIEVVVSPESQLRRKLAAVWNEAHAVDALNEMNHQSVKGASDGHEGAVTAVQQILNAALRLHATDVHIEPLPDEVRVRMRVDGALRTVMSLPPAGLAPLTSRIKIMASLDIAQRRIPQDGRAQVTVNGLVHNLRISTLPSLRGETVVIRLLNDIAELPELRSLGIPERMVPVVHATLRASQGLLLITGPTGSGKTTTLYAAISEINSGRDNFLTIEDPVEYVHPHRGCVVTHREVGVDTDSWHTALKNTLRQAPDVILMGEIRDRETMEHALEFAETGHLAISTLHANNANQALERIINLFPEERRPQLLMGLSQNIRAIVSQRLVPTKEGKRCAAVEVLLGTKTIAELILKARLTDIKEIMEKSENIGMQTFDGALFKLYQADKITFEDAIANADSPNNLRLRIKLAEGKGVEADTGTTGAGASFGTLSLTMVEEEKPDDAASH